MCILFAGYRTYVVDTVETVAPIYLFAALAQRPTFLIAAMAIRHTVTLTTCLSILLGKECIVTLVSALTFYELLLCVCEYYICIIYMYVGICTYPCTYMYMYIHEPVLWVYTCTCISIP